MYASYYSCFSRSSKIMLQQMHLFRFDVQIDDFTHLCRHVSRDWYSYDGGTAVFSALMGGRSTVHNQFRRGQNLTSWERFGACTAEGSTRTKSRLKHWYIPVTIHSFIQRWRGCLGTLRGPLTQESITHPSHTCLALQHASGHRCRPAQTSHSDLALSHSQMHQHMCVLTNLPCAHSTSGHTSCSPPRHQIRASARV